MGLFDSIFQPRKAKESQKAMNEAKGFFQTLTAYQPTFTSWNGFIYESELVRAAVDAKARHISKLKVEFQGTANPKLQAKMRLAPNQFQTYSQFLYRTSTILDNTGTCFITPVFDESMTITGYMPVLPQYCTVVEFKGEPWLKYQFGQGRQAAVELRKVALLTNHQYMNDFFGSSNDALNDTMKLIHIVKQSISEAAKNSVSYRFMARLTNFTTAEDLAKERQRFSEGNLSQGSSDGGLLLFPNKYDNIQQLSQSAYHVDTAQMELIQTNVLNYFGVNLDVIQNRATADQLDAFFNGAIEPFAIQFSEAMTMAIFSERERAQGSKLIANANRLQYMSTTAKASMAQQLLDRGVMSINEARELFNYEPVENGEVRPIRGEYYNAGDREDASEE